ncbi:MAG: MFS transporter [Anaerolineales bacterium]
MKKIRGMKRLFRGVNETVLAISFARFTDALGNSLIYVLLPIYIASMPSPRISWSEPVLVSVVIALYGLVNTILQPFIGVLTDRLPYRKPIITVGLFLMAAGTLAFVFSNQYSNLLLIRALQGVGVALTVPASLTLINASTEKETRGRAMGFYSTLRLVGFAIGPLVGGVILTRLGFDTAFYVGAGVIFLGTILVQLLVHEEPVSELDAPPAKVDFLDERVWDRNMISLAAALFMMASSYSMMGALENEFNARLQQTALGFGIAFSALTVTRMIVQTPVGYLSDKIGRKPLIIIGMISMAPTTILLGYVNTTLQLTGARALQGITSAAIASPALALAGDLTTKDVEGRQMSIVTMGFFLGITIGPLIAGFLTRHSFALPFYIGAVMLIIGAFIVHRYVPDSIRGSDN